MTMLAHGTKKCHIPTARPLSSLEQPKQTNPGAISDHKAQFGFARFCSWDETLEDFCPEQQG